MTIDARAIAETILHQLKAGRDDFNNSGIALMMCWGFSKPRVVDSGLMFNVNGRLLSGTVKVCYNRGKDLYDVIFSDKHKKMSKDIEDVYAEELTRVIDGVVESGK